MKIAVVFPGQGSQYIGMAQDFISSDPQYAAMMAMAEEICQLKINDLCVNGPKEELKRVINLQPAITITNLICWQALKNALDGKVEVSCFAGHSLGEYSALWAAGALSTEDTLRLVSKRGALMEREGKLHPGGMRAVLGLDIKTVADLVAGYRGPGAVTAANQNTPVQTVISGTMDALDEVEERAKEKGAKVLALHVSVANHSPLVADAVPDFADFMTGIEFKSPQFPVYFNVSAATETDPDTIKEMMARQIASPVRWCEIIEGMLAEGVDTFIEVGPKAVLTGLMRKIVPRGTKVTSIQFDTPATMSDCIEKISKT